MFFSLSLPLSLCCAPLRSRMRLPRPAALSVATCSSCCSDSYYSGQPLGAASLLGAGTGRAHPRPGSWSWLLQLPKEPASHGTYSPPVIGKHGYHCPRYGCPSQPLCPAPPGPSPCELLLPSSSNTAFCCPSSSAALLILSPAVRFESASLWVLTRPQARIGYVSVVRA